MFLLHIRSVSGALFYVQEPEKEKEKETEKEATDKGKSVAKMIDSTDTEPLSKVLELTETFKSDEESMSIDDLLAQIPEDMMLPSVTAAEPTKIKFGHGIQIRERDWYKAILPQIYVADKGKAPLVEKEEIKEYPAREMFTLICEDIDFLIQLREAVIEEISSFFHSFSLRRLAVLESVSDLAAKEEQMLAWAETDSLQTAIEETPDVQISLPIAGVPSTDYTEAFAQLRATIDKISLEQENYNTLHAHLAEIIAYINKGRDDKKGGVSSSRGPQPPDDQRRPSGGGSRSEPPRKRGGGSNRGGGSTSSRGFRYWLGGS
ncbi:protein IQ-DOMAIN 14 [Dorcoceras hygrometricum]|uniref:Protein IQ-DOMAIN 14 n=1 Tax=Dorcoceras hygrometricum TaxID=472368 RepID=A0A2Z7AYY3_9LAMI|nr:protein IQ-DOMAIN 14 [Dorcoceras hygrometricum]